MEQIANCELKTKNYKIENQTFDLEVDGVGVSMEQVRGIPRW